MTNIALFVALVAVCWTGGRAQTSCTRTLIGLSPCLNYVTGNSSTPSSSCCSQLSNVVTSQPQCLCLLLNNTASSYGYNVNQTLALALPTVCNVQTPPISRCSAANGPSASPDTPQSPQADSPSDDETPDVPETPSETDVPSGAGSKTVPGRDGSSIGGSNRGATFSFMCTLVLMFSAWAFS
ncbi:hypothetical protein ACS0TY_007566 [Phlomoides rotata]